MWKFYLDTNLIFKNLLSPLLNILSQMNDSLCLDRLFTNLYENCYKERIIYHFNTAFEILREICETVTTYVVILTKIVNSAQYENVIK